MKLELTSIVAVLVFSATFNAMGDIWDNGDDTGSGATPLTISTNWATHGPHTLTSGVDNADWFSFELQSGKRYRFESMGDTDTTGNLYVDSSGITEVDYQDYQVWDAGEGNNFQILYTPTISGTYYLKVGIDPNSTSAAYDLQYLNEPSLDQWDPDDDSSASATLLKMAVPVNSNGVHKLGPIDTNDWFKFVLVTNVVYTIESSGGWDTSAMLYDNALNLIIDSRDDFDLYDDAGEDTNFKLVFTPSNTGVYHLNAQAYEPGYDIEYSLLYHASADPDSDGDGQSDVDEFIAGTDPNDSSSNFAITNWLPGSLVIEWPVISNRVYQVYKTESITTPFSPLGPTINYPQNSYTDTVSAASGFYQVEVQLQ